MCVARKDELYFRHAYARQSRSHRVRNVVSTNAITVNCRPIISFKEVVHKIKPPYNNLTWVRNQMMWLCERRKCHPVGSSNLQALVKKKKFRLCRQQGKIEINLQFDIFENMSFILNLLEFIDDNPAINNHLSNSKNLNPYDYSYYLANVPIKSRYWVITIPELIIYLTRRVYR